MNTSAVVRPYGWSMRSMTRQGNSQEARDHDLVLVSRTVQGDTDAYRELVERYQQRIHSVVLGVLGDYEDALDVTQEAFIKAYNNLSSFRRASGFYTWIYRIAYNLAIDERRRRYRHVESVTGDLVELERASHRQSELPGSVLGASQDPETIYRRGEMKHDIESALDTLSAEHRAVIVLREIEGLSYAEISEVVGCSKGTVMSRLHHARKRMQEALRLRGSMPNGFGESSENQMKANSTKSEG